MRKLLIIVILFVTIACTHNQAKSTKSSTEGGIAKFEFLQDFHNFGNLQAGETVAFSFEFKNSGNSKLLIEQIKTDCGCIQVEYPKEKIEPGESAYIEIIFNSAGETGRIYKSITVYSNTEVKETTLAIAATVENELINLYT